MWEWIKKNKFLVLVLVIIAYFAFQFAKSFFGVDLLSLNVPQKSVSYDSFSESSGVNTFGSVGSAGITNPGLASYKAPSSRDYAPQTGSGNRLVIQESNLSLLVRNVTEARDKILDFVNSKGGYMVSSNVSNPQDAPTGTVVIRIPSDSLKDGLNYFHSLSVKVVSENLSGRDVTDQYVDIDTRIAQLERTKSKIEDILSRATQINDISNLTQQILNYQNQIDSLKGQQMSLEQNSKLAKLTIYLSTDEIALPYAPSETFRPVVIFKLAVRSLVKTLRGLATIAIWLIVYSVIWLPVIFIIRFLKKKFGKNKDSGKTLPN